MLQGFTASSSLELSYCCQRYTQEYLLEQIPIDVLEVCSSFTLLRLEVISLYLIVECWFLHGFIVPLAFAPFGTSHVNTLIIFLYFYNTNFEC